MRSIAILVVLRLLHVAFAATPAVTPAASQTLSVGETTARQVRASKDHVAVVVKPNGHVDEAPVEKIAATTRAQEAKPHKAAVPVEDKALAAEAFNHTAHAAPEKTQKAAEEKAPVLKADKVVPIEKTVDLQKEALFVHMAEAEESWKSAFFFLASLVLIVVLVGACVMQIKQNVEAGKVEAGQSLRSTPAASSSAAKLPSHLNDSSSTSDSGEKIAMLFDRVRQSLEDLSHEKGTDLPTAPGDVAGGKGGQI